MTSIFMHKETGSVDTREGWISSYESYELEERGLTAEQAFIQDLGKTLFELEEGSCEMKTTINGKGFVAEFNNDLNGYILTFTSGNVAQTQFAIETNRLHADFGEKFLRRYTDYDDDLTEEETALVEEFLEERNHSKEF